ncbi:MAG: elongation factor P [Psittacicella sp.]
MATYSTNEFKAGLKVILDGEPAVIVDAQFFKPGKGNALMRTRVKKLLSDKTLDINYKSGITLEAADVVDLDLVFSYKDEDFYHFMHPETFEMYQADKKAVGDNAKWILDQANCIVTLWNGSPIVVTPPNFVDLEVTETDPGLKGDTAGTGGKPATLVTGAVVRVPLFIQIGEVIRVDTRSGEYLSRVK